VLLQRRAEVVEESKGQIRATAEESRGSGELSREEQRQWSKGIHVEGKAAESLGRVEQRQGRAKAEGT
jgi:hypothetical protein